MQIDLSDGVARSFCANQAQQFHLTAAKGAHQHWCNQPAERQITTKPPWYAQVKRVTHPRTARSRLKLVYVYEPLERTMDELTADAAWRFANVVSERHRDRDAEEALLDPHHAAHSHRPVVLQHPESAPCTQQRGQIVGILVESEYFLHGRRHELFEVKQHAPNVSRVRLSGDNRALVSKTLK